MPHLFNRQSLRKKPPHPQEVSIGIAIMLLTAGICTALVLDARRPGTPLFEVSDEYLRGPDAAGGAAAPLPDLERADWSPARDVRVFTPDTLYEKINGRADLYLQYNFRRLTFAKYLEDNDPERDVQVWLYDMSGPDNARGIFTAERSEHVEAVDVGREGYRSGASIFFWKGPMYVGIMTIDEALAEDCAWIAGRVAAGIEDTAQRSWETVVFSQPGLVEDSREYLANEAFGLDFLSAMHTARLAAADGPPVTLFAHRADGPAAAASLLQRYTAFFREFGSVLAEQDGIVVGDGGGVIDAVFVVGPYLAGVSEAPSAATAGAEAGAFRQHLLSLGEQLP